MYRARSATALPAGALGTAPAQRERQKGREIRGRRRGGTVFSVWRVALGAGGRCGPGRAEMRASAHAGAGGGEATFWLLQQGHSTAGTIARSSSFEVLGGDL